MALHVFGRWLKYDCSLVEYQELYTCAVFILRQIVLSIALTLAVQDIWAAAKYQSNIEYFTTGGEGSGLNLLKFEDPCQGFRCWWMKTQRCERDGLIFDAGQGQCLKGPLLLGPHPHFPITHQVLSSRIIHGCLDVKRSIWVNLAVKACNPNTEKIGFCGCLHIFEIYIWGL